MLGQITPPVKRTSIGSQLDLSCRIRVRVLVEGLLGVPYEERFSIFEQSTFVRVSDRYGLMRTHCRNHNAIVSARVHRRQPIDVLSCGVIVLT